MVVLTFCHFFLGDASYLPGVMGLNNIKNNDGMNVVFQALTHVRPLRDFFLDKALTEEVEEQSPLVRHFAELCRKMWSPNRFRAHVSPHEILQVCTRLHLCGVISRQWVS